MKTTEIYVEVKKSKNFQTYTAGETVRLNEDDDLETERNMAMTRCRRAVMAQITLDTPKPLKSNI